MRTALAGDAAAYQALLRRSAQMLRPYLLKTLRSPSDVDDVLQEILISLHRARHTYDGKRPFAPWLFAIAKFRLQDHLRRLYRDKLRHAADVTDMADFLAAPVTEGDPNNEYVKETLSYLPKKQAMILELIHLEGLTAEETGQRLGMSGTAVKVAAHRAYKHLRKKLAAA
jgi:RNA polymerase sigma-70 factor (ECF subfamily)